MNHVATAPFKGSQEVEINLGAWGKDEPAVLGADGQVATEAVELSILGILLLEVESGNYAKIPAMFIVFVDMAKLDGEDEGAGFEGCFFDIIVRNGNVLAFDA